MHASLLVWGDVFLAAYVSSLPSDSAAFDVTSKKAIQSPHQPGVPIGFDWIEYLDLAKHLVAHGGQGSSQEARLRSAISRAYYTAFHKAKENTISSDATGGFAPTGKLSMRCKRATTRDGGRLA